MEWWWIRDSPFPFHFHTSYILPRMLPLRADVGTVNPSVNLLMLRSDQKKLELIIGDFVKADLPYFDVCISNTPYQVCLHLYTHVPPWWLSTPTRFELAWAASPYPSPQRLYAHSAITISALLSLVDISLHTPLFSPLRSQSSLTAVPTRDAPRFARHSLTLRSPPL